MGQNSPQPRHNFRRIVLVAAIAYILAIGIRLHEIAQPTPHPDEPLWQERSWEIVECIKRGDFEMMTVKMAHPGVPAAFVLAAGQWLNQKQMDRMGLELGMPGYRNRLTAARVANTLVASLIVPLLIFAGSGLVGAAPAVLAGIFVALDPNHIWLSRLAHIDAILILLSAATVLTFAHAIRKNSLGGKLLAGTFWGLAFATKATAIFIVPAVLLFALIDNLQRRQSTDSIKSSVLPFAELWSFILGYGVFVAVWQRLWHPLNTIAVHYNIGVGRIRPLDDAVHWINLHSAAGITLIAAPLCVAAFLLYWGRRKQNVAIRTVLRHSAGLVSLLALIPLTSMLRPALIKNCIGYTNWIFGLTKMKHTAYGETWAPMQYGYFELFARKLPDLLLVGVFLCCAFAVYFLIRDRKRELVSRISWFALLAFLTLGFWELGLSLSSKQAFRYAMPSVPLLYLLACVGLYYGSVAAAQIFGSRYRHSVQVGLLIIFCLGHGAWLAKIAPDYSLYFNRVSGGLRAALARNYPISVDGQEAGISFLHERATEDGTPVLVTAFEEHSLLNYEYERLYGPRTKVTPLVKFYQWWPRGNGRFVFAYEHFSKRMTRYELPEKYKQPIFQYKVDGVTIYTIYAPPLPEPRQPIYFEISEMHRDTGDVVVPETPSAITLIDAEPGKHAAGTLLDGDSVRLPPGHYLGHFSLASHFSKTATQTEDTVARISLGPGCSRTVHLRELSLDSFNDIELDCLFDSLTQAALKIEWLGNAPLQIKEIHLDKADDAGPGELPSPKDDRATQPGVEVAVHTGR